MNNFEYVPPRIYNPIKKELIKLINLVQNEVREYFTFQFEFVGSSSRNMITCDKKNNIGFDFDVNFIINKCDGYKPKTIRNIFMKAFNKHRNKFKYNKIEDGRRVITIKKVERKNSKIVHSCDFAIVNNYIDDEGYEYQKFIYHNKKQHTYEWQGQTDGFYELYDKVEWIKENKLWNEVREYYLEKKNRNRNEHKKSRSLYAEAVNDIYYKYYSNEYNNEEEDDIIDLQGVWLTKHMQQYR